MSAANNLVGKRYGKLTVIRRAENSRKGNTMWICRCECGKEITTYGYALTGGNQKAADVTGVKSSLSTIAQRNEHTGRQRRDCIESGGILGFAVTTRKQPDMNITEAEG